MIAYFDTSSLLKLYLLEDNTDVVKQLSSDADAAATSIVAYAETRAGLARAMVNRRIEESQYATIKDAFAAQWPRYIVKDVTEPLVRLAGDLAERHVLRGFDAIHLASAVTLQRELGEPFTFSAFDERLSRSALAEGLLLP